jgi:GWxTD domain-containing protein
VGVAGFQLRAVMGWMAARRLRRSGVCLAAPAWALRVAWMAERLRVSRPVVLLESALADGPVVMGYLRPVILMPVGVLAGLPAAQIEAILAHELAHLRRHDYLINLAQTFIEGLFFYHPAAWWISRVIRAERENCCDDIAVALTGNAREFAAALTALEHNRTAASELALAATGGSLVKRVRRILERPEHSRAGFAPLASAVLTLGTAAVLCAWQAAPASAPSPQAAPSPQGAPTAQVAPSAQTPPAAQTVLGPQAAPAVQIAPSPQAAPAPQRRPVEIASEQSSQDDAMRKLVEQLKSNGAPATTSSPTTSSSAALPTVYRKWLNEDVAYIITDQERAAIKALTNDDAYEKFIEQFWARRDPTPNTAENEFKNEHYRRIAYANEHFASPTVAGWKTDRGRIYITFGPPDEIEDHSSGGLYQRPPEEGGGEINTAPFQQWRYRYIENVGNNVIIEFVDATKSGEFRMTTDPAEKAFPLTVPGAAPTQGQQLGGRGGPVQGNTFTSTGGDPRVTVTVGTGGTVNVALQQNAVAGAWNIVGSIQSGTHVAANLRDHGNISNPSGAQPFQYRARFHVEPGLYTVNIAVQDGSGTVRTQSVQFYVN